MFLVNSVWTREQNQLSRDNKMRDMLFDDFEIAMKVVIVGNGSVGKSSMIQRFCRGIFTRDYKKTIGVDFLERVMTIDDQSVRLMLWDTAGQEEFDAITRTYYRGANACVLACSVTDKESFLALPKWKNKVCRECGDIPMVLVANKLDLQKQAVVDSAELEGMARSLGIPKLIRTSVKEDMNVNCVFTFLSQVYVQSVLSQQAQEDESNNTNGDLGDDLDEQDLVNYRINSPLFGGGNKNNKSSSNNNKGHHNKSNGISILQPSSNNKAIKNGGGGGGGRNFFSRNPVILKSSNGGTGNNNNNGTSNHRSFFSNKKQHNKESCTNGSSQSHHYNIFRTSAAAINNKSSAFNTNGLLDNHNTHHHHILHNHRNGQQIVPPRPNSYYVNGNGAAGGGVGISMDPNRWTDTNVPFRLDLASGKKRRREPCTIL